MIHLHTHVRWCARLQWSMGGLLVAIGLGFYIAGYRPETQRLAELQAGIVRKQGELRDNQGKTRILPAVAADVKNLRQQLSQAKRLPALQEMPAFMKDLNSLFQASALKSPSVMPGMPSHGDLFSQQPLNLSFTGDFTDVYNFLRHAEDMPRLTRITSMSIKGKDTSGGKVDVQLLMNIYFAPD